MEVEEIMDNELAEMQQMEEIMYDELAEMQDCIKCCEEENIEELEKQKKKKLEFKIIIIDKVSKK